MSFFVTSAGPGKGADLGGLAGADKTCQTLAQAAGAGSKTWHAYLSTQGPGAVNARDRIGSGPWQNAKGAVVAKDVAELHGKNNLTKDTALTEKGEKVNGRGDTRAAPAVFQAARSRICSSTWWGCLAASATRAQCLRTVPSGLIHTLERITPLVFLPYIILSPYAPHASMTLRSGSDRSGNGS